MPVGASLLANAVRGSGYRLLGIACRQAPTQNQAGASLLAMRIYVGASLLAMRIYVGASLLAMRIYVGASLLANAVRGSGHRLQASSYKKQALKIAYRHASIQNHLQKTC